MRKQWVMGTSLLLVMSLAACGETEDTGEEAAEDTTEESMEEETAEEPQEDTDTDGEVGAEADFPVTIEDAVGEEVTIEEEPQRIVSLIPSNTETAFALGAGDRIVGVTDNDTYPEEVNDIQSVGGMEFDVETILSLEPDLVLAHESSAHFSEEGFNQLQEADITVLFVSEASGFDDAYDSIEMIGAATGTYEEAETLVAEMQEGVNDLQEQAQEISEDERQTVWLEVGPAPEIYTTGTNTFLHEILEMINAENAAQNEEGWVQYSEEDVIALNPDVIITTYGFYVEDPEEEILSRSGWSDIPAVENERIYDVHADKVTRPGPRLVDGAEAIAELVYPDVFNNE
nr:ABC transporter substrate-binding protein [Bacillus sp. FJAT-44742]